MCSIAEQAKALVVWFGVAMNGAKPHCRTEMARVVSDGAKRWATTAATYVQKQTLKHMRINAGPKKLVHKRAKQRAKKYVNILMEVQWNGCRRIGEGVKNGLL